jgi:hypothetical protein
LQFVPHVVSAHFLRKMCVTISAFTGIQCLVLDRKEYVPATRCTIQP